MDDLTAPANMGGGASRSKTAVTQQPPAASHGFTPRPRREEVRRPEAASHWLAQPTAESGWPAADAARSDKAVDVAEIFRMDDTLVGVHRTAERLRRLHARFLAFEPHGAPRS